MLLSRSAFLEEEASARELREREREIGMRGEYGRWGDTKTQTHTHTHTRNKRTHTHRERERERGESSHSGLSEACAPFLIRSWP